MSRQLRHGELSATVITGVVCVRRTVIAVGLEEEDRMDQWVQDAESVSCLTCCISNSLHLILYLLVHSSRSI